MRVLHHFSKPGGDWAEIRSPEVAQPDVLAFLVFVDGSLLVSETFPRDRKDEYPAALAACVNHFVDDGWSHKTSEPASDVD